MAHSPIAARAFTVLESCPAMSLEATGREIVDSGFYMVLGTADADGRPWASPVWYAPAGYREFFWVSSPEVQHSRNIAVRPEISIVVFDSRQPVGTGQAVYMSATAQQVTGPDEEQRGMEIFDRRGREQGETRRWTVDDVQPPKPIRLYRATVTAHSMLDKSDQGPGYDHRTGVAL
jgi:nitroimidazol reductase NimA-like FMN-containing flavoprotein (pyridoxamine 5'-phosphate oxidase superfamily)